MATQTIADAKVPSRWTQAVRAISKAQGDINELKYNVDASQQYGNLKSDVRKAADLIREAGLLLAKHQNEFM